MGNARTVIGIDSGGTLCRAVADGPTGRVEVAGTGCNWTTDPERAAACIRAVVNELASRAGVSPQALREATAYLGAAGITCARDAEALAGALADILPDLAVEDDLPVSVAGALGGSGDGFVAALGTGSFLAARHGGALRRAGGWGLVLGDEGSGAWLGRALLSRCLHVRDGLAEATPLTSAAMDRFGNDPAQVVRFAAHADPQAFAALAPMVARAFEAGDPAASELVNAGAGWVERGLHALGWRGGARLCLLGGLAPLYARALPSHLSDAVVPPLGNALDGARALALARAEAR